MKIPKIISKNNHEYIFVKVYPSHVLYKEMITGILECFLKQDLIILERRRKNKDPKAYWKDEKLIKVNLEEVEE